MDKKLITELLDNIEKNEVPEIKDKINIAMKTAILKSIKDKRTKIEDGE